MANFLQIMIMVAIFTVFLFYGKITGSKVENSKFKEDEQVELVLNCDRKMETEIDKSISRLIVVGQRNTKFPENERQVRPYCNLAHRTFELVDAYSEKCLPEFGKSTMRVFMHVMGVELKGVCKSGKLSKRARDLLAAAPCANSGLNKWERCYQELINKFTGIMNAPVEMRIPMGCCNFHHLVECLTDEAEEIKECTKKTIDYITKYVHKIIDPIIFILCNEYSEPSDKCDKMVRLTPNRTKDQRKYHSFVKPLINIGLSLGDEEFNGNVPTVDKVAKQK